MPARTSPAPAATAATIPDAAPFAPELLPALAAAGFVDATALSLDLEPVDAADVVAGSPLAGSRSLVTSPAFTIGVWEITPGVVTDTEVDETFVVLTGEATVEFEGSGRILQLAPGVVGQLAAGDRTTWRVTSTLRKVYVAPVAAAAAASAAAESIEAVTAATADGGAA